MFLERFISLRYLRSRRQTKSLSVISYIAIFGVALGVAALLITLSIMNGFEDDIKEALIGANAHITIEKLISETSDDEYQTVLKPILTADENIKSIDPFIFRQALLVGKNRSYGALVRGIDVVAQENNTDLLASIKTTTDQALSHDDSLKILKSLNNPEIYQSENQNNQLLDNVILGSTLAKNLKVTVGDSILIIPPETRVTPFGQMPRTKRLVVRGIYNSGLSGYDEALALINIDTAKKIFNQAKFSGVALYLKNPSNLDQVKNELSKKIAFPFTLRTWIQDNQNLFVVITLEKYALAIILTLIILVAAFNIISSIIMLVNEKKRDISVLKALGATDSSILKIFFIQGLILGSFGTILGLILGLSACYAILNFNIISIPAGVYVKNKIPMAIEYWQVFSVIIISFIICSVVTLFPARTAAKTNTAAGLRYE